MGNELIKAADLGIAALDPSNESSELLAEALAGERLGLGDFEFVKWPTGGRTKFERTVLGNTEDVPSIEGVVIHQGMSRAYWKTPEPVEGQDPDCKSPDNEFGYGDPGDTLRAQSPPKGCADCPMSQWGTGKNDRGQACKLTRDVFMLPKGGGVLPLVVSIPPASLTEGKGYFVDLAGFGLRYWHVVTKLTLVEAKNKDGQKYAEARLSMVNRLDDDSVAAVAKYRDDLGDSFVRAIPAATVEGTAEDDDGK